MRELIKKEQLVTIIPQDFKNSNKGKVLDVDMEGFRMELKYKPEGLIKNHICDFYSMTDNGYLYFESYIQSLENNVISIANPVKHRFLQRRKFTRIKFLENLELKYDKITHKVRSGKQDENAPLLVVDAVGGCFYGIIYPYHFSKSGILAEIIDSCGGDEESNPILVKFIFKK